MRKSPKIEIKPEDLKILEKRAKSRTNSKQAIERAKIILACHAGKPVWKTAKEMGTYPNKIIEWRNRYIQDGLKGLNDKPRSGKPPKQKDLRDKVLEKIGTDVPKGYGRWDAPLLGAYLNCSADVIWRILRKEGISLQRQRSWCISTDKHFASKAADIIGLYLAPPQNAIVLSVDEKPSIQALERRTGYIETRNGKHIRAYKSTYKRNGTLNLFAALQVASGFIKGKITKHKTREDFLEFMDSIVSDFGKEKELHVIMDNYCTHKRNETWLEKNPNVYFHYTPTSASWLNMVEIWFGILSMKSLKGASFHSTDALGEHIMCFMENYNKHCNPFKWRKRKVKGAQIKFNIDNLRN
jgi:transposase